MNDPEMTSIETIIAQMDHMLTAYHLHDVLEEELFDGLTQLALQLLHVLTRPIGAAPGPFTAN